MIGALATLDRRLLAPAPPERLAALRIAVGGFGVAWLVLRFSHVWSMGAFDGARFEPVGVLAPLDGRPSAIVTRAALVLAVVAGIAFTTGWRFHVSGPSFAVLLLVVTTYRSSWGQVFHTENLLVLHAGVLALAPAADALSLDQRRTGRAPSPSPAYGWPVRLAAVITVLTYTVSGVAKLHDAGLAWVTGDALRNHVAFDNLRKILLDDIHSPVGAVAVRHDWLFRPLAAGALAVELLAPLALVGRRLRHLWLAAAWAFHVGVLALMAIVFPYHLLGVAYAPLLPLERVLAWRPVVPRPWRSRPSRRWRQQGASLSTAAPTAAVPPSTVIDSGASRRIS